MSNLLQKASIITTSTAYNTGKILSVKPVQTYGPELVNSWTNKDFSSFASNGSNITQMVSSGSGNNCYSSVSFTSGKTYELKFTSSQSITAQIRISLNINLTSAQVVLSNPTSGSNSIIFTPTSNYVYIGFYAPGSFTDTQISAFSLREKTDADFDFTRNSSATRVGSNGLIQTVASNIPRIDYTGGVGSWKFEPQRINLLLYSENFNSGWTKSGVSVTSGFTSPDGTTNAYKLIENSSNSTHFTWLQASTTSATHCFSLFAKVGERKRIALRDNQIGNSAVFDLESGSVVSGSGGSIVYFGNGFYRITLKGNYASAATRHEIYILPDNATTATTSYQGDGSSGVYIFGAQLEVGSYPTSYIPTSGQSGGVTRLADVANNAGSSNLINSTEGVLYADISALANDLTYRQISISDGTATNRISIFYQNTSNQIAVESSGTSTNLGIYNQNLTITNVNKIALKYKANDCGLWINGFEVATDTSFASFSSGTLSKLSFNRGDVIQNFYGNTKSVAVFKEALTDLELECLSSWMSFSDLGINFGYTVE